MKATISYIGMCLALAAGLLLVASTASAQATKTPIEGEVAWCRPLGAWEKIWTTKDGVRHGRNQKYRCIYRGDVVGREIGWDNNNIDFEAGEASGHGPLSFDGEILGEPVTAVGQFTSEYSKIDDVWIGTWDSVWHLSDGGLLKLSTHPHEANVYPVPFSAIILDPPGRN